MIELSKEKIKEIEQQFELPVYVFHQDEFEENYRDLENAFRAVYPNYHICYSYKTNYTPAICRCVKELGGYAEVVSDMEYELALKVGYTPKKIVYNGPAKGRYLESHILNGGISNIDRMEEVQRICEIAKEHPETSIGTGIRVNFDIDAGYTSRFGIDIGIVPEVIRLLESNGVCVNGIHCHMSRARSLEAWKNRAVTMLNLVKQCNLHGLEYISLGSGMYGRMDKELHEQFSNVPTYKEYAETVFSLFAEFYGEAERKPIVFTEPGTTLVSKYVDFFAKVEGIKKIRNKCFVLLGGSFHNLGETCQMKQLPIRVFAQGKNKIRVEKADFVGYTCLEQDIMYRDFSGEIAQGDYVQFGNAGGYSVVEKPPFIMPNCAMIAISNGEARLIKRKEKMEDIFSTFVF